MALSYYTVTYESGRPRTFRLDEREAKRYQALSQSERSNVAKIAKGKPSPRAKRS